MTDTADIISGNLKFIKQTETPAQSRLYSTAAAFIVAAVYFTLKGCRESLLIGWFLNADEQLNLDQGVLGTNLFAYCLNNPANMFDKHGHWPSWNQVIAVLVVVSVVVVVAAVSVATVGVGVTLVAAGIGATVGIAGKYVEDITYNTATGRAGLDVFAPTSSW